MILVMIGTDGTERVITDVCDVRYVMGEVFWKVGDIMDAEFEEGNSMPLDEFEGFRYAYVMGDDVEVTWGCPGMVKWFIYENVDIAHLYHHDAQEHIRKTDAALGREPAADKSF